jgi:branched-subunit amino acid ABC-type transport system permease component
MDFFVPLILSGIAMGAIYGLVALGFVLLINAVNIINFAQGEFLMLGSFFVFTFVAIWGLPLLPAAALMIVAAAIVGVVFERIAYRPLRGGDIATFIVSTLAASLVIRNVGPERHCQSGSRGDEREACCLRAQGQSEEGRVADGRITLERQIGNCHHRQ